MAEEHLKTLETALEQLRDHRRNLASSLAGQYRRGDTEQWRQQFVEVQQAIEAMGRAIADEQGIAKGGPKYQMFTVGN